MLKQYFNVNWYCLLFFYLFMGIFKQLGGKGFIVFKERFSVNWCV